MASPEVQAELVTIFKEIGKIKEEMKQTLESDAGQSLQASAGISGVRPSSYQKTVEDALKIADDESNKAFFSEEQPDISKAQQALKSAQEAQQGLKKLVEEKKMREDLFLARQKAFTKPIPTPLSAPASTVSPTAASPKLASATTAAVSGASTKDLLSAYSEYLKAQGADSPKDWKRKAEGKPSMLSFPNKEAANEFFRTQAEAGNDFIAIAMGPDGKPTGEYAIGSGGEFKAGKLDPSQLARVQRGLDDPKCNATFVADISKALKEENNDGVNKAIEALNVLRRPEGFVPPGKAGASAQPTAQLGHLRGGAEASPEPAGRPRGPGQTDSSS